MAGLYGGAEEQGAKSGYTCGRQLPGHAVGQPHLATVSCRNRNFELLLGARDVNHRTQVTTHCVNCHAQDTLSLLLTNAGKEERPLLAQQFPHLLQHKAQPNMVVCGTCNQFRFHLLDEGNELRRRCVYCQDTQHLGYETKAGTGTQPRTFTTPPAS